MYCRNCGNPLHDKAIACPKCGVPPMIERNFCNHCGAQTTAAQMLCTQCGASLAGADPKSKEKLVAGLLAIFLGALGIHKFYLGYNKEGLIMLLVTVVGGMVTCGMSSFAISIIALIEGIIYLKHTF